MIGVESSLDCQLGGANLINRQGSELFPCLVSCPRGPEYVMDS